MTQETEIIIPSTSGFKQANPLDEYKIGGRLGSGSFTEVRQCTHTLTQQKHAIKTVNKKNNRGFELFQNEIAILKRISHPNIIKLHDVYETPEALHIIMELIEGGELYCELLSYGPFTEEKTSYIFGQIVNAIDYLHKHDIVHRDLKLENILYNKKTDQIKLTDFGLSKMVRVSDQEMMKTRCGTPTYVAPEIVNGLSYTSSVDIWSLGVVLYLLLYCTYPFGGESLSEIYESILNGKVEFPKDVNISDEAKDLIRNILKSDTKERFTMEQIQNHSWMKKFVNNPSNSQD